MTGSPVGIGDRVLVRDRMWRVQQAQSLSEGRTLLHLSAVDGIPGSMSVVVPPDICAVLPSEELSFGSGYVDSFQSWSFAQRLLNASLVPPSSALTGARFGRVNLEAYQLAPTLRILSKIRPSLLIADDVGLGKTVEAGLVLLELIARGRANRVLVVTPSGLLLQWQEEMQEKFGLDFTLIENAAGLSRVQTQLPAGVSPWDALPRVLTSIDYLKKETIKHRALRKRWDLIIVDEAHSLGEGGTPKNPYSTQRRRLGLELRKNARGLLLLTATPHNGYVHAFRSLIELVAPTSATLYGEESKRRRRIDEAMVRRMKAQIVRRNESSEEVPVFPLRHVEGIAVSVTPEEKELLDKVSAYCSRTLRSAEGGEDAELVSFAMQIVKKRALSSRRAITNTIENRLKALRKDEERDEKPTRAEVRELQENLPMSEKTAERIAMRVVRSAIPKEERRRNSEKRSLNGIKRLLKALPDRDPKIAALLEEIRSVGEREPNEKIIIFTEYLDTLNAIWDEIENDELLRGRAVILRGGLSLRQRVRVQERFTAPDIRILLATDAASEGLNLQEHCRRIIHVELPWNPNRLEQRNGRVDRYGQTRSPEIRFLYYPDSPEDDVLHRLVHKIEQMYEDRVSTPDILGIMRGAGELEAGLANLDPTSADINAQKDSLVQLFDDRTAEFIRDVQPLIGSGDTGADDLEDLRSLLTTSQPLLPDDQALENAVRQMIGPAAFRTTNAEHVYRITVPLQYRGPEVEALYGRATFRRSVAVHHRAADVEFITPLHPLVRALATECRRRFLQIYASQRGLTPKRLAARRVPENEAASAVFTFLAHVDGHDGTIEERLIAVRVSSTGEIVGDTQQALGWIEESAGVGEVPAPLVARLFEQDFPNLADAAAEEAMQLMTREAERIRSERTELAQKLHEHVELDLADRLAELDEDERRARGLIEDTGALRLFGETETRGGFDARRAAARVEAERHHEEIDAFAVVNAPMPPRPLGALFLVPEGQS